MSQPFGLWAETDLLRQDAFRDYVTHMQKVIDELEGTLGTVLPVADHIADEADKEIVASVDNQVDEVRAILIGLKGLSVGDANAVNELGQLLERAEEMNSEIASSWGNGSTHT
jgi:uncharacterized protein Yka (UPF0111/DUF47 family)